MSNKLKIVRSLLPAIILLLVAVAPYGCKRSEFDGLKEGKVVYDVTFEGEEINPMVQAMLPSEVVTYFSNNKTCMVISMGMNVMDTKLVSDASTYTYTTMVAAMGKKIAMVLNKEQVDKNYLDRVELKVMHTDEMKEIAGVQCKKATVTDSTDHTYDVYYTEELALNDPNWSSPFRDIDGLLMEYSIAVGGMKMNLKAKEIVNTEQNQDIFKIPEGYEIVKDANEFRFGF
jgi:GLPGLI family protein